MSDVLIRMRESIARVRHETLEIAATDDGVRVTTDCMYPSNGLVRVYVRGGAERVMISDDGEAVGEALSAGILMRNPDTILRSIVQSQGLRIKGGVIHTPVVPIDAAPLAIMLLANAAKDTAQWAYDHQKIKRTRDFRALLAAFLKQTFDDQVAPATIVGASNKAHKFLNVISFSNGARFIVDTVVNDASSINARVVANMDVRHNPNLRVEQRIVYDDEDSWSPADLNLLQAGAKLVPFSKSGEVIKRVATEARATG